LRFATSNDGTSSRSAARTWACSTWTSGAWAGCTRSTAVSWQRSRGRISILIRGPGGGSIAVRSGRAWSGHWAQKTGENVSTEMLTGISSLWDQVWKSSAPLEMEFKVAASRNSGCSGDESHAPPRARTNEAEKKLFSSTSMIDVLAEQRAQTTRSFRKRLQITKKIADYE